MQAQQAPYTETAVLASSHAEKEKSSHLLYQIATVAAILLFLVSFWSC